MTAHATSTAQCGSPPWLIKEHGMPLNQVAPHMHWCMICHDDHRDLGHQKWEAFLAKVEGYQ